jgi:hypothetical protein
MRTRHPMALAGCVPVTRKIAVILHRMWVDGTDFRWEPRAIAT